MNKFLKTYELTTEILNIISSTKSYCYIVSPYIKTWPQLDRILDIASKQNIFLTFIIREDKSSSILINKLNKEYGFEVIVIKDLHIKLYLNESKCIISTMNLYDASQHNNLELGYSLNNSAEIKRDIIENYILTDKTAVKHSGKFENHRKEVQNKYSAIIEIFNKHGYCVDCNKQITLDFRSNTPYYIRCGECYYKNETKYPQMYNKTKIKYCHFCGQKHESFESKPLHEECQKLLTEYKTEIKNHH